ncbi:MAG: FG-GAP-like repeat-containing protein [Cyanobacteria bacterium P01_H01_bin.150]
MTVSFNPIKNFDVGSRTWYVNVGDFDGDGNSDLIRTNTGPRGDRGARVSVLLGDGTGDFSIGPDFRFEIPNVIPSVRVGDFNSDGKDDLATASDEISVLLASGNGNFNSTEDFEFGNSPYPVAVGDFNGDGNSDLARGNFSPEVSVKLADGNGGFSATQSFDIGSFLSGPLTIGDFNKDGKDDIAAVNAVVSGGVGAIAVILTDGNGGLGTAQNFDVEGRLSSLVVGDFNGDGNSDLAGNIENSNKVSVFLGNGNGDFTTAQNFAVGNVNLFSIKVGDFDGDGKDDLATTNEFNNNISVLSGYDNSGFSTTQSFTVADIPNSLTVADFNNDGKDDLATTSRDSNNVSVLIAKDSTAPTYLTLSNDTIQENQSINTEVGIFSTTDPNTDDTFTYELVTGEGDTDNSSFSINGDKLIAKDSFDFETKSSYNIRVKTTDAGNESFEKTLTINVSDVIDTPTIRTVTDNGSEMEVIDLTGNPGETVIANFEIDRDAAYDNNVYFYKVDGDDGNIGGLTPDDNGYLQTALNNVVNPDFGLSATQDATSTTGSLSLEGGDILGVVIVADGTLEQAISNIDSVEGVYLSYMGAGASTDNGTFDHIRFNSTTSTFEFEDLPNGGDQDFDDLKIKIDFQ